MRQPNDGVMRFQVFGVPRERVFASITPNDGICTFMSDVKRMSHEDLWLPDPNQRYRIYLGMYFKMRQVALSIRRPVRYNDNDMWDRRCVASGNFDQLWPLFLTYCELME